MAPSDSQLLRAFVEKSDEAAFGELVSRRIDFVYACALRQIGGDTHRAADISQEVFVALARRAPKLIQHTSLLGWLCTATRFASVDAIRRDQARKVREQEAFAMQLTDHEEPADWTRLQPVLDAVLTELPDSDREVVLARFFDRQSFADIARNSGLTENAAQKRVYRALSRLREGLARRHVTSTAAALGVMLSAYSGVSAPVGLALSITKSALSASAAGTGLGGVTLLVFMIKKYGLGIATLLAVGGVTTTIVGSRADEAARQELAASRKAHAALVAQVSRRQIAMALAKLAERHPAALAALHERWNAARVRYLQVGDIDDVLSQFALLSDVLKRPDAVVQLYDQLPEDDRRRTFVSIRASKQLIEARRYQDVIRGRSADSMLRMFALTNDSQKRPQLLNYSIKTAAENVEVLAGAGEIESARELLRKVLAADSTPETRALLAKHLSRAGRPELLDQ